MGKLGAFGTVITAYNYIKEYVNAQADYKKIPALTFEFLITRKDFIRCFLYSGSRIAHLAALYKACRSLLEPLLVIRL